MTQHASDSTGHTPGPWSVNKYGSVGAGKFGTWPIIAAIEPFYGEDRKHGDHTANARLIAAAPETAAERDRLRKVNGELLAALKIAMGYVAADLGFFERGNAAIAKAEPQTKGGDDEG